MCPALLMNEASEVENVKLTWYSIHNLSFGTLHWLLAETNNSPLSTMR